MQRTSTSTHRAAARVLAVSDATPARVALLVTATLGALLLLALLLL